MRSIVLVIDGFGIGAMPDAGALRPADRHADTLGSLTCWAGSHTRDLHIPHLNAMGLALLRPDLDLPGSDPLPMACLARRAALGYPGADSYAGHQTMMGADMSHISLCRLADRLDIVADTLRADGHTVTVLGASQPILIVDNEMLVHDNLEADPGLNWNISGRLDHVSWDAIKHTAQQVRAIAPVARVIAVGGYSARLLTDVVRPGADGTYGLDTPATGFYQHPGLQVEHMGAKINYEAQLPEQVAQAGYPVTLIGKAADLLQTHTTVDRRPCVEVSETLDHVVNCLTDPQPRLIVANIQQTDLAGHQEDPQRFVNLLEYVDGRIAGVLGRLTTGDQLIVTGDHGNDPLIGHAYHTREYVPVLTTRPGTEPTVHQADDYPTLAAVADQVAGHLHISGWTRTTGSIALTV